MSPYDVQFEVVFFRDGSGVKPVAVFLRSLSSNSTLAVNARAAIKALQDGLLHKEPFTKALGEGKDALRILFFYAGGRRVVIVHAFLKKTQKTPPRELTIARQRTKRFEQTDNEGIENENRTRSRTR